MVVTTGANGNRVSMTAHGEQLRVADQDMSAAVPSVVDAEGAAISNRPANEGLYLLGRPTLKRFIRHVNYNAVNSPDEGTLVDEWQAGHKALVALESDEAGLADDPQIIKMGRQRAIFGTIATSADLIRAIASDA